MVWQCQAKGLLTVSTPVPASAECPVEEPERQYRAPRWLRRPLRPPLVENGGCKQRVDGCALQTHETSRADRFPQVPQQDGYYDGDAERPHLNGTGQPRPPYQREPAR